MSFSVPNGTPGVLPTYVATAREVFYANRQFAQFLAGPLVVDGTLSDNPLNAPYDWLLYGGTLMGKVTASGKYRNSIIGLTTAAAANTDTSLTVSSATATEVARQIVVGGGTASLIITGPPAANGTVASTAVTATAASGTTITLSAAVGVAKVAGSLIQPADGSQNITTTICDVYGLQIVDQLHANRVDVYDAQLLAGGGILNVGYIVNYPADSSLKTFIKSQLKAATTGVQFSDDITG